MMTHPAANSDDFAPLHAGLAVSRSIRVVVARKAAHHASRDDERRQHGHGELMEHAGGSVCRVEARQHCEERQSEDEKHSAGERHGGPLRDERQRSRHRLTVGQKEGGRQAMLRCSMSRRCSTALALAEHPGLNDLPRVQQLRSAFLNAFSVGSKA